MVEKLTPEDISFKKHDSGKLEYSLFPSKVLEDVVKVMMYGVYTKGYAPDNWKKCPDTIRYYNAAIRHIEAWRRGEYNDSSGFPHLAHALCNIVFMHYLEEEKHGKQT